MAELGAGVAARDLVPGDPDALERLAARLSLFGDGMSDAGVALENVQAVGWRGPAADAFSALLDEQPDTYRTAGSSFTEAAGAIRSYTAVLRDAQAEAGRAVSMYEDAARESEQWQQSRTAHDNAVRSAEAAGEPPPAGPAPSSTDPGAARTVPPASSCLPARASRSAPRASVPPRRSSRRPRRRPRSRACSTR